MAHSATSSTTAERLRQKRVRDRTNRDAWMGAEDEPATKFAKDQIKSIIERIERLEDEKKALSDDIRDVYAEAKGNGYDVKALRTIVRMRKQPADERAEAETILETYLQALGMI